MEVEANPDFYDGAPLLDRIVFKVIPDGNARLAQLRAGEIDFTVIDPPQLDALRGASGITVRRAPQVNYYFSRSTTICRSSRISGCGRR